MAGTPFASYQGWSSLQRPVYSPGLLLEDEDLNAGIAYTQGLMRLMLKSLFGCGVICGLDVSVTSSCQGTKRKLVVAPGIAVDGDGNLIEVTKPWGHEFGPDCDDGWPGRLWVVLCYREKCCRPKDVTCAADGDTQSAQTRVRAGFEIAIWEKLPACTCRCTTGAEDDEPEEGDGDCGCGGRAKARVEASAGSDRQRKDTSATDEPCPCYADHFKGVCGCECCKCVVLAKVIDPATLIDKDEDGNELKPPIVKVDSSMVRRVRPVLNGYLKCLLEAPAPPRDIAVAERIATSARAGKGARAAGEAQQAGSVRQKLQKARTDAGAAEKIDES
jgi:hypothetical protein